MGLEGLVSKHRERPYEAGRSKHWVKVNEPEAPGYGTGDGFVLIRYISAAPTSMGSPKLGPREHLDYPVQREIAD
jgi:ATP-dependent DNA ligase